MNATTPMHGGASARHERPSWAPPGVKFHGGRPVYPQNRRSMSLRLYDRERAEGKEAAARLLSSEVIGRLSSWDRSPVKEAEYWRSVGLDWARHLKAGGKGELPSKTVKRQAARIAQLEEQLRALGFDPSTLPEVSASTRDADDDDADPDWEDDGEPELDEPAEDLAPEDSGGALPRLRSAIAERDARQADSAGGADAKPRTSTRPKRAAAKKAKRGAPRRRKARGAR